MIRTLLILWAVPMGLFWGWYFLSFYDINFGFLFLSRAVHEVVFELYGQILGIDPTGIPGMVARACVLDTLLIGAIIAFRRRAAIIAWVRAWRNRDVQEAPAAPNA